MDIIKKCWKKSIAFSSELKSINQQIISMVKKKKQKNSLTNLDKFMSRRILMTVVLSLSLGFCRLLAPRVRKTDKMLRKPKS